jgi:hypothetical protein
MKNEVLAPQGQDFQSTSDHCIEKKNEELRSAALTVAVCVFFVFVLGLATLLRLVLAGLAALLALPRLTALLALSRLPTLLIFLFHIVCHKDSS